MVIISLARFDTYIIGKQLQGDKVVVNKQWAQ